jgi:phosphoserine phosphatase
MRPKLIFLDLEGTLLRIPPIVTQTQVAQSAWTILAQLLGPDCLKEEEETKKKWEAKSYLNYVSWMEDTIRIHQKYGLDRKIFTSLINMIDEMPGIRTAADRFHAWGSRIAIVTGGFKALADKAQLAIRAHHTFAACEYFFDERGQLAHWNLLPSDYEGKLHFMRLLMREYDFGRDECILVADGINDVPLAREVGVSISFNGQAALKSVAALSVDQPRGEEDFAVVAELVENL